MNVVERFFLRAGRWELFHLLITVPSLVASGFHRQGSGGAWADPVARMAFFSAWQLCFLVWIGSMGQFLNTLKESSMRSSTRVLWLAVILPPSSGFVSGVFFNGPNAQPSWLDKFPVYFSLFCMFYAAHFAASSLAMVQKKREVTLRYYAAPLLLICFFPIGVWIIQPKINRLYAQTKRRSALRGGGNQALRQL